MHKIGPIAVLYHFIYTAIINFKIKNVNRNKCKLYLSDATVHTEMMAVLREKRINSYSFTPRELKQISLVLRGLYHGTDIEELKSHLDGITPDVISKVTKFTTPYSMKNNCDTGLFLVTLHPGKNLSDISHVKFVLSQSVVWERPKKKDREIQCRRCQHWGHMAKNCNSDYRCVKCDQHHLPGECNRNENDNSNPKCVNCGEEGHPANWRGCTFYKNYVSRKKQRLREVQEIKSAASSNVNKYISSAVNPAKSFASFFHKPSADNKPVQPSIVETFLKLAEFFLEPEELTLEQELNNFMNEYKNMPKVEAKGEFLRLLKKVQQRSRQIDLTNTLNSNKIDICFLQECHLRRQKKVFLNNYNFIYDNSSIGVAIALKNNISYKRVGIDDLSILGTFLELQLKINNTTRKILVGSLYVKCNTTANNLRNSLDKILLVANGFDLFLLGGDLNSKNQAWGDSTGNQNGNILQNWLEVHSLDITRICHNNPSFPSANSFLDHYLISTSLMNNDTPNYRISSLPTFSDHFPLKLEINMNASDILLNNPHYYTSYKNTDWKRFQLDLTISSNILMPPNNRNLENTEIEQIIVEFNESFKSAHDLHTTKVEIKNGKFLYSDKIKNFYKIKYRWQRELKKIYHRYGNRLSNEYNILSKQIQLLKTIIKDLVNMEQADIFNNKLKHIKPGPHAFKQVYNIVGKHKSPFCHNICIDNVTVTNSDTCSAYFKEYYSNIYTEKLPVNPVADLAHRVGSHIENTSHHIYSFNSEFNSLDNEDAYHFTNVHNIKSIISNIKNKKSSGLDGISNFLIKKFPDPTIELLTILFNNCLNNCYFPRAWKIAKILPMKKKGSCNRAEDFRPISLLSNIGKLLEHVIKSKLENEFLIEPIPSYQFGLSFCMTTSTLPRRIKSAILGGNGKILGRILKDFF
ncbi:RNA-directed DNA polymerase from mobile element jockey [Lucilia cuprina]|nr:RNA-directed DNA polymerase from mobile element jockey [Lucilia cuprina]